MEPGCPSPKKPASTGPHKRVSTSKAPLHSLAAGSGPSPFVTAQSLGCGTFPSPFPSAQLSCRAPGWADALSELLLSAGCRWLLPQITQPGRGAATAIKGAPQREIVLGTEAWQSG
ncbi:hypothetical protein KIL84_002022 [Mauremys mutica]|uniref:Uncharacterized protein n=1 Tax=Mauremys mutica TaxID=74926 RepID=A0A9D3XKR3_9SAUR|nr:hypothetical protein KIL84_002022 [Mauremys mutica]